MSHQKIVTGNEPAPVQAIIPPVNIMVEQVWRVMQQVPGAFGRVGYVTQLTNAQMGEVLNAVLENTILLRAFAKALNVVLPDSLELREMMQRDRVDFLKAVLAKGGLKPEQEEFIKKELGELGELGELEGCSGECGGCEKHAGEQAEDQADLDDTKEAGHV